MQDASSVRYTYRMNHTPEIKKAIHFAARKHHGQLRKSGPSDAPLPYIVHLFSVALLVAEDGADDEIVIAALLHDTLEDTDTTREELVAAFGERVAGLVEGVSEQGSIEDWRARKQDYLDHLETGDPDALLVAIADKVDNIESRIEEFEAQGDLYFGHWKQPNEAYLWFYGETARIAQERLPDHPLTKRLAETHARQVEVFAGK
jgi:(p)ppGpp synthase/HD superfamily hydrolase